MGLVSISSCGGGGGRVRTQGPRKGEASYIVGGRERWGVRKANHWGWDEMGKEEEKAQRTGKVDVG